VTSQLKSRLKLVAKLAILAVLVYFVRHSVLDGWTKLQDQIAAGRWSPGDLRWSWLVVAAVAY
jgi:hypothetical protein